MGFFSRIASSFNQSLGAPDPQLLQHGILGRAQITSLEAGGFSVSVAGGFDERVCTIGLLVYVEGTPPYPVTITQRLTEVMIPTIAAQGFHAVRVDPTNLGRVAIDFNSAAPTVQVTTPDGPGSAAWLLANGRPIVVVFVSMNPLGMTNAAGDGIYALTLTVAEGMPTPYQLQVGNPVPASALPLAYPGARLHARLGAGVDDVVVDWARGLAAPAAPPASPPPPPPPPPPPGA